MRGKLSGCKQLAFHQPNDTWGRCWSLALLSHVTIIAVRGEREEEGGEAEREIMLVGLSYYNLNNNVFVICRFAVREKCQMTPLKWFKMQIFLIENGHVEVTYYIM